MEKIKNMIRYATSFTTIPSLIKLIGKGILLYTTIITFILIILCIDGIYDNNYLLHTVGICVSLAVLCKLSISFSDLEILTFSKWFDKLQENNSSL